MEVLKSFNTVYTQKTKHRKKCRECGRLIQDGERVYVEQVKVERFYGGSTTGFKYYTRWYFWHADCRTQA